jgi:hypothetical protein
MFLKNGLSVTGDVVECTADVLVLRYLRNSCLTNHWQERPKVSRTTKTSHQPGTGMPPFIAVFTILARLRRSLAYPASRAVHSPNESSNPCYIYIYARFSVGTNEP